MFGGSRRRQPPAQPLTRETADPNAATAAAAVFMSRRDSNSSLSSAAAAAALRARPMTPTNVAEVQSKRARRRSPSLNSLTGSVRGRRELTRSPSVGSMMERTFRTPSPGRSPAPREHVPPVPALPSVDQVMANHQTNRQIKGSKKAALQTQPFRTASQKIRDGGQPSWFGPATTRDAKARPADAAIISSTYVSESRPGSVSPSINFSYPRARALSPSSSSSVDEHTLVYDPNSRRMVPRIELVSRLQDAHDGLEKPKKKKKSASLDRTGSHLSKGSVNGRTRAPVLDEGTAQDSAHPPETVKSPSIGSQPTRAPPVASGAAGAVTSSSSEYAVPKKKKKKSKQKMQQEPLESQNGAVFVDRQPMDREQTIGKRPTLAKKPSVVKEEPQLEEVESQKSPREHIAAAPVVAIGNSGHVSQPNIQTPENNDETRVRHSRVQSASPARSARFGASPGDQLVVKHEPPARSVSPRKSALKLAASVRGVSPSDDGSEASGSRGFSSHDNEEAGLGRKKSVRVSWDDTSTVVVGEASQPLRTESPMIPSPQTKKPWHSVVTKFGRRESVAVAEDETMTPRPALPQFGSVREKKGREPEERLLVRPSDRTFTPAENASSTTTTTAVGPSTDAMVGAPVSQDLASRNAANISKYREPLPAVIPSIENREDQSVGAESSEDDFDTDATSEAEDDGEQIPMTPSNQTTPAASVTPSKPLAVQSTSDEVIPTISISQPSPRATGSSDTSPPGFFPDTQVTATDKADGDDKPDESDIFVPANTGESIVVGSGMTGTAEEEENSEDDRPSNAYEDPDEIEEIEGDGFLSLDAVVDSSTTDMVPKKYAEEKPVLTQTVDRAEATQSATGMAAKKSDMSVPDDWENAKAYWKSLSVEKRRQLEIEALSETGEGATTGTTTAPPTGPLVTAAPALSSERLYQIQPGTQWSAKGNVHEAGRGGHEEDDEDEEPNSNDAAQSAKRASIVATHAKTTAEAPKPNNRASMRQSMRADPPAPSPSDMGVERPEGMRKSMRNGPATTKSAARRRTGEGPVSKPASAEMPSASPKITMRQSLRASRSDGDTLRPTLSSSGRPASYHQPSTKGLAKSHKKQTISSDNLTSSSTIRPTLRRRGSDDSESSFKRKRSASVSHDPHHYRLSMRSSLREPSSPVPSAKRFSLRSLSPPGFRGSSFSSPPPQTSSPGGGGSGFMRHSLRDRPTSSSLRLKKDSAKKSSGLGLGRRSKGASRFADSSDEEDSGPTHFQSRFLDSSDDEEPAPLPKSNGLPKSLRNGNGPTSNTLSRQVTSPEPPDGDGAIQQPKRGGASTNGQPSLQRRWSDRGTIEPLPQNDLSRPASRRGSFMSILRRRKGTSDKVSKGSMGEGAAGGDAVLGRNPEEAAQLRSNSLHEGDPSWPLPNGNGTEGEDGMPKQPSRPSTAGGVVTTPKKSSFLRRRSASQGVIGLGQARVDANEAVPPIPAELAQTGFQQQQPQQGKKKKFGALRKMFGIHD
ncbi:hypothetical protein E4U43_004597 [Claviceps pusilla]|uniref:Uncharacterized protein n=1 Tax=Claviceps pusilla TaxID=123648 RepID=A0A9P7NGX9_9HYPO|nr:hypothetical protein E4U43_004597 [Claviceps pusilla]